MTSLTVAWLFVKPYLLLLLRKVLSLPWQVWAGLALVVVFLMYGNHVEKRTRAEVKAEYEKAAQVEKERQLFVYRQALQRAQQEAMRSQQELVGYATELERIKQEALDAKNNQQVCIPESAADKYRRLRDSKFNRFRDPSGRTP